MRRAVIALVAALAASSCSSYPGGVSGDVELTMVFDDVGDLVRQHSVQVADVRVGSVTGIELTDDFKAKITVRIKDGLELPKEGTIALVRSTSLLGEKFIELRVPEDREGNGPFLEDGDTVEETDAAPELEFVAEQAAQVLGAVASQDIATLIDTGAVGFGGRGPELQQLLGDLATMSNTLAERTDDITAIIDGLDRATTDLAAGDAELDRLLINLAETTQVLADNREEAVQALQQLTRLAKVQNDEVLRPFRDDVDRQIKQLDAIVAEVAAARGEVGNLVDWLDRFTTNIPLGIPGDFAQVYSWFVTATDDDRIEPAP
ncbi:MAG: MCE family protein [Actinomycetota bacterium]